MEDQRSSSQSRSTRGRVYRNRGGYKGNAGQQDFASSHSHQGQPHRPPHNGRGTQRSGTIDEPQQEDKQNYEDGSVKNSHSNSNNNNSKGPACKSLQKVKHIRQTSAQKSSAQRSCDLKNSHSRESSSVASQTGPNCEAPVKPAASHSSSNSIASKHVEYVSTQTDPDDCEANDTTRSTSSHLAEESNGSPSSPGRRLVEFVRAGDVAAVNCLLQSQPKVLHSHLEPALREACHVGHKFLVHKLVRSGARVCLCKTALHSAARNGFLDIVSFLLSNGINVDGLDSAMNTALMAAISPAGSTDMLNLLLSHRARVHFQNKDGMSALMKAVDVLDIDAVRILLHAGSNLKQRNKKGQTARDIAVQRGIGEVFDALKSEVVKHQKKSGPKNALTIAVAENNLEALRILSDCKDLDGQLKKPEKKTKNKFTERTKTAKDTTLQRLLNSMCTDAEAGKKPEKVKLDMAQVLFTSGARPDRSINQHDPSMLIQATKADLFEVVELMLKYNNLKLNAIRNCRSALMTAAETGRVDILKVLLKAKASVPVKNSLGDTALSLALINNQVECAEIILQEYKPSKADLQEMSRNTLRRGHLKAARLLASHCDIKEMSQSLLITAVFSGNTEVVQYVLDQGVDINLPHAGGNTALATAVEDVEESLSKPMVNFLIDNKADLNRGRSRVSPLCCAVTRDPELVRLLVDRGADVNEPGCDQDNTALMAACQGPRCTHPDTVGILLEAGADPNLTDRQGDAAIHKAIAAGNTRALRELLTAGANIEARNSNNLTPLLQAASGGQAEVVSVLKNCGANMTAVDSSGQNSILRALLFASPPTQQDTLKHLAYDSEQLNQRTSDGHTALMLAAIDRNASAVRVLLELGADPSVMNRPTPDEEVTALSLLLTNIMHAPQESMDCIEALVKHGAVSSIPRRCCVALFHAILCDYRQLVQLFITRGMAPLCMDFIDLGGSRLSVSMLGIGNSVGRNLSPLGAALVRGIMPIANYLLGNWFLTPADAVGSPLLKDVRAVLVERSKTESLAFLDTHLGQPMSLVQLSFIAVSARMGEMRGRQDRVGQTGLPPILQDKLMFRHETCQMDLESVSPSHHSGDDDSYDEIDQDESYDASDYYYDSDQIMGLGFSLGDYNSDYEFLF